MSDISSALLRYQISRLERDLPCEISPRDLSYHPRARNLKRDIASASNKNSLQRVYCDLSREISMLSLSILRDNTITSNEISRERCRHRLELTGSLLFLDIISLGETLKRDIALSETSQESFSSEYSHENILERVFSRDRHRLERNLS